MPILNFENSDLPEGSRSYAVDIPDGQVDAAVKSLEDSGWHLVEDEDEDPADNPSTGTNTSEAQSAPSTPEGI